jgi:HAD superfamily hydrolase (TIGR01509 family)
MPSKTSAVIFDMDGVLADTESLIADATIRMFKDCYDVALTVENFRPFIGTGAVRYVEGPAEAAGINVDLDQALQVRHDNFVALLEQGACNALPGAIDLVNGIADHDALLLGMATSSPQKKAEETWHAIELPSDRFDALVSGDMVTHKKPHPEIYLHAAALLDVDPATCIVIEDALTGVTSAKAAGMQCIAVTNSFGRDALADADWVVDSLLEVTAEKLVNPLVAD